MSRTRTKGSNNSPLTWFSAYVKTFIRCLQRRFIQGLFSQRIMHRFICLNSRMFNIFTEHYVNTLLFHNVWIYLMKITITRDGRKTSFRFKQVHKWSQLCTCSWVNEFITSSDVFQLTNMHTCEFYSIKALKDHQNYGVGRVDAHRVTLVTITSKQLHDPYLVFPKLFKIH